MLLRAMLEQHWLHKVERNHIIMIQIAVSPVITTLDVAVRVHVRVHLVVLQSQLLTSHDSLLKSVCVCVCRLCKTRPPIELPTPVCVCEREWKQQSKSVWETRKPEIILGHFDCSWAIEWNKRTWYDNNNDDDHRNKKDRGRKRQKGRNGRREQMVAKPVKRSAVLWINMNSSAHADLSSLPLFITHKHLRQPFPLSLFVSLKHTEEKNMQTLLANWNMHSCSLLLKTPKLPRFYPKSSVNIVSKWGYVIDKVFRLVEIIHSPTLPNLEVITCASPAFVRSQGQRWGVLHIHFSFRKSGSSLIKRCCCQGNDWRAVIGGWRCPAAICLEGSHWPLHCFPQSCAATEASPPDQSLCYPHEEVGE